MATMRTTAQKNEETTEVEVSAKVGHADVRKPLLASVGAADLAVEKLAALPAMYGPEVKKLSDRVVGLPTQAQSVVRTLPATVSSQLADLQVRANELYNSFADRGEKRVSSIRRNPAARETVEHAKAAAAEAKATKDAGRRTADAAGRATEEAAQPS
jgi:hypothetical protein